jgi:NAD(P)-dependent dehydrogenase (short-subunit alcohol dehydrogenase family)
MDQVKKEAMSVQSLKRLVDPKDIAALAVFLASDAAKSISGRHAAGQLIPSLNRRPPPML